MSRRYKRLTRYEQFVLLFWKWSRKLKIEHLTIERDNRLNCHVAVISQGKKNIKIQYNSRRLARWSYALLISGLFHEIGHIRHKLPYDTKEQMIYSEYRAELYSLRMVKNHYPRLLNEIINYTVNNCLLNAKWIRENPIHYEAFKKIKSYT